jgi:multidrug resistance efflux pump
MSAIVGVTVKPGDRVRAGDVLVRLDARQLTAGQARADAGLAAALEGAAAAEADVEGAASALALAKVSHARIATLAERKVATPAEIDEAVAALRGAEARMRLPRHARRRSDKGSRPPAQPRAMPRSTHRSPRSWRRSTG